MFIYVIFNQDNYHEAMNLPTELIRHIECFVTEDISIQTHCFGCQFGNTFRTCMDCNNELWATQFEQEESSNYYDEQLHRKKQRLQRKASKIWKRKTDECQCEWDCELENNVGVENQWDCEWQNMLIDENRLIELQDKIDAINIHIDLHRN